LALAAALWWIVLGGDAEERAERVLTEAPSQRRTAMALSAFFYGFIPLLLGLIAVAAGMGQAIADSAASAAPGASRLTPTAAVLATGAALFLAGDVMTRRQLGLGPVRLRAAVAVASLATIPAGALLGLDAQLALLTALLAVPPITDARDTSRARQALGTARE
jgi:low temperature requirement protein LtrA